MLNAVQFVWESVHTFLCYVPVLNSIPGDAPKPSHVQLCRVIWVCVRMRWVRRFPLVDPVPHHGTWAFQGPSSGRTYCTKGRVPLGTHTHPLRQSWWQEPQHLGCSLCMRYVGLSFTRAHYSYLCCIHIVLWVIIIFTYYCTMHILLCIYIMNAEFVCVTHFEWSNKD